MNESSSNTPGDRRRAAVLLWEARNEFGRITPTNRQIIRCAAFGVPVDFTTSSFQVKYDGAIQAENSAIENNENLPLHTNRPVPDAVADPRVIRWLLTTESIEPLLSSRGVHISSAKFESLLDLRSCHLSRPLWLMKCSLLSGIDMLGATCSVFGLSGSLVCQGSMQGTRHTYAIRADGLRADIVFLRGIRSHGGVRFVGAHIADNLECDHGIFVSTGRFAISASGININGTLFLRRIRYVYGAIDLTGARIGYLVDYNDSGTDSKCDIVLSDCEYKDIYAWPSLEAHDRLMWLSKHDTTVRSWSKIPSADYIPDPRPYRWLAEVMKKKGYEDEARIVLRACAERRMAGLARRAKRDVEANPSAYCGLLAIMWLFAGTCAWLSGLAGTISTWIVSVLVLIPALVALLLLPRHPEIAGRIEWLRVFFTQRLYKYAVGHGYARWRALLWMAAFILLGFVMFSESSRPPVDGRMQPVQALALKEWSGGQSSTLADSLPKYNALIYSADTLIPLVSFHQENHWMPSGNGRWGWFIKNMYLPFHITMGWVIATLFVASFTRLMRQES